jgi:CBS domain-containing protein
MIVRALLKSKSSNEVATTTADKTVGETAKLMAKWKIGACLVVEGENNIIGIFSERDVMRGLANHGGAVENVKVADLMTRSVLTCGPDDTVEHIMGMMTNNRIRHVPVTENGKLIGIITIGDVVKSRMEEATMQADQLREYVMAGR